MHRTLFILVIVGCLSLASTSTDSNKQLDIFAELNKFESAPAQALREMSPADSGYNYADQLSEIEDQLLGRDVYVKEGSPFRMYSRFKQANPESRTYAEKAARLIQATKSLKKLGLSDETLRQSSARFSVISDACIPLPTCTPSKYRTVDGSCNNLKKPLMGRSFTTFRRLVAPAYSDGIEQPRVARDGTDLPSARQVAFTLFPDADVPDNRITLSVMQWGQFIDHDFSLTPQFQFSDGTNIQCCSDTGQFLPADLKHPACFAIAIPADDPFYRTFNRSCMNFVRSMAGPNNDCFLGHANQLNELTHWMDGSQVYGSTEEVANILREFRGGRLRTSESNGRPLPPIYPVPCNKTNGAPCFFAGDARVEEMPLLTVMHTLLVREHNRVAARLAQLNPSWNDEIVYQESRRIVVAEMQHITFTEWLPNILSPATLVRYGLTFPSFGSVLDNAYGVIGNMVGFWLDTIENLVTQLFGIEARTNYDDGVDASASTELATAAFRMGHTLLQGLIRIYDKDDKETPLSFNMSDTFNNPSVMRNEPDFFDGAIRSLMNQPAQTLDPHITTEVTDKLFRNISLGHKFGLSLPALNIQRSRDHGIPGYNEYRRICGIGKANHFADLTNVPTSIVNKFKQLYKTVNDIDLFAGGLLEKPVAGGRMGQTFECILADQFSRWRRGDRFFYDVKGQPHSFTGVQLAEIKKATLARIYCDNHDGTIRRMQPKVFNSVGESNARVSCADIPTIDLTKWQNEPV